MARTRLDEAALSRMFSSPSGDVALFLTKKAIKVAGIAKRNCPVDTGRLRASITWELILLAGVITARVGTIVVYAIFVELGTRFMEAQPFLRPALIEGIK